MRSIVILGAGELGGALARQLAAADVASRIILVDDAGQVAQGKALDIRQAAPIDGYSTNLAGTHDESAVLAADAIIVADRAATGQEWRDDHGAALIQRIAHMNPSALILCAGAQQLDLVQRGVREAGIRRHRLLGSAPEGLRAAIVAMVALEASCSPNEVSLSVLGRPPLQLIVPWEDAAIGGRPATAVLDAPAITRIDGRLRRMWPPGPLTLASAATRLLKAGASRSRLSLSAFVVPSERGPAGILPVVVNAAGVAVVLPPALSARNRVRLETALQ